MPVKNILLSLHSTIKQPENVDEGRFIPKQTHFFGEKKVKFDFLYSRAATAAVI